MGLEQRAGDRAKSLSLGMRQRLGVAAALLKDPELLLLDEPLNGLDPRAVTEMRSLMRSLAESGRTVVVSSHLLDEVQLVCDEVIFIDAGRMVGSGSLSELLGGDGPRPITVTVSAADADRAQRVISASDWEFVRCAGRNLTVAPTSQPLWQFVRLLEDSGCCVESVRSGRTVEDLYLDNVLAMDGTERIHDAE